MPETKDRMNRTATTGLHLDDSVFPPFDGFPKEGMNFLRRLKKNNNRPWFHAHKREYEELVRFPMQCLVASLAFRMMDTAPEISFDPNRSIFRIHRDVRFSKNKAPYKTNIAASFNMPAPKKSTTETPGLYVGIEPGSVFIGGGLYMPDGAQLKAIRTAISGKPGEFLAIVKDARFRKQLGGMMGERLVKAPLGFAKDDPMIEYLRHKQFFVGKEYDDEAIVLRPRFLDTVVNVFTDSMPLIRWLARAVGQVC